LLREIRGIVGGRGLFVICENAGPDGEERDGWLLRRERQNRLLWTALNPKEEFRHPLWFREWKKSEDQKELERRLMLLTPPGTYSQVLFNRSEIFESTVPRSGTN
jgi:hypothetical protein